MARAKAEPQQPTTGMTLIVLVGFSLVMFVAAFLVANRRTTKPAA